MSEYKIEKNVPITQRKTNNKYPFAKMQVGDSFFVANFSKSTAQTLLANAGCAYAKSHPNFYWATRVCVENGIKGARIWRVAKEEKQG